MRKAALAIPLSIALAATPALAHRDAHPAAGDPAAERPETKGADRAKERAKRSVRLLGVACVTGPSAENGVVVTLRRGNRHMRRAVGDTPEFIAKIGERTRIRLVGRARVRPEGSTPKRAPRVGGYADLAVGDRVILRFRAPRGTAAADLPPALRIVDNGPAKRCAPAPKEAPAS